MQIISIKQALEITNCLFVDARSSAEYEQGHIPGAVNIPLLENEERALVGTLYKQSGPEPAKKKGLEIVSVKLASMVGEIASLMQQSPGSTLVVYCWRGGMRSKSLVTILELMGIASFQLIGGYKAYRQQVQECLQNLVLRPQIFVLCGSTGVGKTTLLQLLADRGVPVVDLEKLANHRGSAFGQVVLGKPATAHNFYAELLQILHSYNDKPYLFVECESKRVGNVYLPENLYARMQSGHKILVHASIATRIKRLIAEYTDVLTPNNTEIVASFASLGKKLGKKKIAQLTEEYQAGDIIAVTRFLLEGYYDPLYGYETAPANRFELVVDAEDLSQAADEIVQYLERFARG